MSMREEQDRRTVVWVVSAVVVAVVVAVVLALGVAWAFSGSARTPAVNVRSVDPVTTTTNGNQVCAQQVSPVTMPQECHPADPNYQPFTPASAGQVPLP